MPQPSKDWSQQDLKSVHARVTQRILERLEAGEVPWHSPHTAQVGYPRNFQSGKPYRGVNVLLLAMAGYVSPYFLTYQQAQERGGQVRRGEKGYPVVKFGSFTPKSGDEPEDPRYYLRLYTVFNACQIDGVDFPAPPAPPFTPSESTAAATMMIAGMPHSPTIREGASTQTSYDPQRDLIEIPARAFFESEERFYKSLFHELVHATGANSRLARKSLLTNQGRLMRDQTVYSKEELVAEIGAAFLCAHAGIVMDDHQNSAAYVQAWLKVLKDPQHERWVVEAAGHAQRAVDYILNLKP